jgi:hypothetical protein
MEGEVRWLPQHSPPQYRIVDSPLFGTQWMRIVRHGELADGEWIDLHGNDLRAPCDRAQADQDKP